MLWLVVRYLTCELRAANIPISQCATGSNERTKMAPVIPRRQHHFIRHGTTGASSQSGVRNSVRPSPLRTPWPNFS